jgi:hypothetical protein
MNAYSRTEHAKAPVLTREKAAELISRYPRVSDAEAKAILKFLRHGRHLDVGVLTADPKLKPRLDLFMEEHASHFRIGVGEASALIAGILGFLIVCWLIWEAARPGSL